MESIDKTNRIVDLERHIASLIKGSITKKKIGSSYYYYLRTYENGKRKEKYIPFEDLDFIRGQIEHRKILEAELKNIQKKSINERIDNNGFISNIHTGSFLKDFSHAVLKYKKRECFSVLQEYVFDEINDKVLILYGLRRTGKTTLIRQIISMMSDSQLSKSAFIQITHNNTLPEINHDLKKLQEDGYKYVFIDEVTLMKDFIDGAALFSDVYASCGMRIVLSGTDSLGFAFSADESLYDRAIMIHTTFIPYREFERVLGVKGVDEFIKYGGTMCLGDTRYNLTSPFANKYKANEYSDIAIAKNIQHALEYYQQGNHFRNLYELYSKNELTSAINRVIEDINHRFTLDILTKEFKSNDLALSARNLRNDRSNPNTILDDINTKEVTERLIEILEIRNKENQSIRLNNAYVEEIKEYLSVLDLIDEIGVISLSNTNKRFSRIVVAQPGLRYAQSSALIESLLLDDSISNLSAKDRAYVFSRIQREIIGRMMEELVLLETKIANPNKQVFTLQFAIGEFDMVIYDPKAISCELYEIKHSTEIDKSQYRHLMDIDKCKMTEHHFGQITKKCILYRGKNNFVNDIEYINVEEYLLMIGKTKV